MIINNRESVRERENNINKTKISEMKNESCEE